MVVVVVAVLSLLTAACAADEQSAAPEQSTSRPPSVTDSQAPPQSPGAGGRTLVGVVGEEGNPDAFTITLADASGTEVTMLPAGAYTVQINDQAGAVGTSGRRRGTTAGPSLSTTSAREAGLETRGTTPRHRAIGVAA